MTRTYTTAERAVKIYDLVVSVFDYNCTSDIITPLELVESQVDRVISKNPDDTYLVPGAGIGTYVSVLISKGVNPSNIYAIEIDPAYHELGDGIFRRFGVNYTHTDFITWRPNMLFNVIIGNPPYQDSSTQSHDKKLWTQFVNRSLELTVDGGTVSFVTPSSLVGRTRLPAQMRKLLSTVYSLDWIDHTAKSYFPSVGVDICSWSITKRPYTGETLVTDSEGSRVVDIREELPIPSSNKFKDDLAEKIRSGISDTGVPELTRESNDVDQVPDDNGEFLNYHAGKNKFFRTNSICKNTGRLKVVFSFSATYKQWFITEANVSGTNVYSYVDSVEQGLEIGNTLMHPIMAFYIDTWRRTAGFCPAIKNNGALPDIRGLDDDQIIKKFNLTDQEVEYIMSNHKSYKSVDRVFL